MSSSEGVSVDTDVVMWEYDVALGVSLLLFHWDLSLIATDDSPNIRGIKLLGSLSTKHHSSTMGCYRSHDLEVRTKTTAQSGAGRS